MIQNVILGLLIILCILLVLSLIKKPFDAETHNCLFKLLPVRIKKNADGSKMAKFDILIHKKYKYFINFPLLFKFYGNAPFTGNFHISYILPKEHKRETLLNKSIAFVDETIEYEVFITDVVIERISIEIILTNQIGKPFISFEILENSTCDLVELYKVEIKL